MINYTSEWSLCFLSCLWFIAERLENRTVGHFEEQIVNKHISTSPEKKQHHSKNIINWHHFVSSWQSTSSFPILFSSVSLVCKTTQALTGCWFISKPSSASSWLFFFLGSLPRASASSRVVVSGRPRVSGNINVSTPMMKAKIPTMSYSGVTMHNEKMC